MNELPDIAIGVIVAAIIAGLISLLGLIISKEQKVSDFRQAWIDSLRGEISALISHANAIHGASTANNGNAADIWKVVREDFIGINAAAASIRLRLNPKENYSVTVLQIIEELEAGLSPCVTTDHKQLNDIEKRLVSSAQILLKQEWRRVRSGERVYRYARMVALIFLAASALTLILAAFNSVVGQ